METIQNLSAALAVGTVSSRDLVEDCLSKIEAADGEGARVFVRVDRDAVIAQADAIDQLRQTGASPSHLAGIPVSIKDLFDMQGQVTAAGSKVLKQTPPAKFDCPAVSRLRAAGLILIGRTNMTEFAYSGLGLNPHYGTPRNPYDRETGRAPGGSSAGAAVSVTDGMAAAGLGTDTGGSCRIPAAMCGITGYKPTQNRVPLNGVVPLSSTLDSIGPLAQTVTCCRELDAVLAQQPIHRQSIAAPGLRLGIVREIMLEGMDGKVANDFDHALKRLRDAGATVIEADLPELLALDNINAKGGFASAEAYAWHRAYLENQFDEYDPRVGARIMRGKDQSAVDYIELLAARQRVIQAIGRRSSRFDAMICPTIPVIAPTLVELEDDNEYGRINMLVLRNPSVMNFLDRCAISVPMHQSGTAPTGLMITGEHGGDNTLFDIAETVEQILAN